MADTKVTRVANNRTCRICQATGNLKACGSCTQAWYCSKEHQVQDWKTHKPECKSLASKMLKIDEDKIISQMSSLDVKQCKGTY